MFGDNHIHFMQLALKEAVKAFDSNEIPIGAIITKENRIIGRGYNQVEMLKDPTAHAEIIAITAACNNLGDKFLNDCNIYITVEPCVMCTGALILSRIENIFYGCMEPKYGAAGSLFNIPAHSAINHKPNIYGGILEEDSASLMKLFFENKKNRSFN